MSTRPKLGRVLITDRSAAFFGPASIGCSKNALYGLIDDLRDGKRGPASLLLLLFRAIFI